MGFGDSCYGGGDAVPGMMMPEPLFLSWSSLDMNDWDWALVKSENYLRQD